MNTQTLLEVGKWLDDDKDYELSTQEKYNEFVKKRNYNYEFLSDGDVPGFDRANKYYNGESPDKA